LLPSLAKARRQAKMTACNATLHDFGTSHLMYAHSNDPYFIPPLYVGTTNGAGGTPSVGLASDDNLFGLWWYKYAKNIDSWSCPATTYRVRKPDKVVHDNTTIVSKPATNGLPPKDFVDFKITTGGVADQNDFADIAQRPTTGNHIGGYGTSYEYHGWSVCAVGRCVKTQINWWWPNYGVIAPGALLTTRINKPSGANSILMHDADDGPDAIGAPPGGAGNNDAEPWDNHGTDGMNILFADGHAVTARKYEVSPGKSQIDQYWDRSDCGVPATVDPTAPPYNCPP